MFNPKVFVQTMITLASASLGLVSALAWNEAIKAVLKQLLGEADSVIGLLIYAMTATALAIVVLTLLARVASRIGGGAVITREAD